MNARSGLTVVELLIGIAVVAGLIWWHVARESEKRERARIAEQEEKARAAIEAERQARQEKERKAQEEARLAKERAERERKETERKKAEAAKAKRAADARLAERAKESIDDAVEYSKMPVELAFWSARYRVLLAKFEDAELGFISEAKGTERPKGVTKRTNFWYVGLDYVSTGRIYEIEANPGGPIIVHALTEASLPEETESATFLKGMYSGKGVLMSGRNAWICGSANGKRSVALRKLIDGFSPSDADILDFRKLMDNMKLRVAQNVRYRVTLKRLDGRSSTQVAIVPTDTSIDRNKLMKALKDDLRRLVAQRRSVGVENGPKLKKYRRTVVMYDGTHIKRDMHGITYVPRNFQHFGTAENGTERSETVEGFRREWEALCAEAKRQERREQEIARENQERKDRHERDKERAEATSKISDDNARTEIDNYVVLIERGRGK